MQSVTIRSHVGSDGMLNLQIPVELKDVDVEVIVTLKTLEVGDLETSPQANGWPSGFFEKTFGSLPDFPEIEPEGNYEDREEFK